MGTWDVEGMLHGMDMETFMDWRRFYHHAPWGEIRGDLRMAISCALTANAHRDTKKRPSPYSPMDFLEMTPSGRSTASTTTATAGRPGSTTSRYKPVTASQFAALSSSLRASYGVQPKPPAEPLAESSAS